MAEGAGRERKAHARRERAATPVRTRIWRRREGWKPTHDEDVDDCEARGSERWRADVKRTRHVRSDDVRDGRGDARNAGKKKPTATTTGTTIATRSDYLFKLLLIGAWRGTEEEDVRGRMRKDDSKTWHDGCDAVD